MVADGQISFLLIADRPEPRKTNPGQSRLSEPRFRLAEVILYHLIPPSSFLKKERKKEILDVFLHPVSHCSEGLKPPLPKHLLTKWWRSPALFQERVWAAFWVSPDTHAMPCPDLMLPAHVWSPGLSLGSERRGVNGSPPPPASDGQHPREACSLRSVERELQFGKSRRLPPSSSKELNQKFINYMTAD